MELFIYFTNSITVLLVHNMLSEVKLQIHYVPPCTWWIIDHLRMVRLESMLGMLNHNSY